MIVEISKKGEKEIELFEKNSHCKKNKKILKCYYFELQQMKASKNLEEYRRIPRSGVKKFHSLSGKFNNCYAVGISPRYRIVIFPIDNIEINKCTIICLLHAIHDYHS